MSAGGRASGPQSPVASGEWESISNELLISMTLQDFETGHMSAVSLSILQLRILVFWGCARTG